MSKRRKRNWERKRKKRNVRVVKGRPQFEQAYHNSMVLHTYHKDCMDRLRYILKEIKK